VSFADFKFSDSTLSEQIYTDFRSKYLDIYDKVHSNEAVEKVSILEDVDFELELVRRDEINVDYILRLLANMVGKDEPQRTIIKRNSYDLMSSEPELRSKRELFEKFIDQNTPK